MVVEVQHQSMVGLQADEVRKLLERAGRPLQLAFRPKHALEPALAGFAGGGLSASRAGADMAYVQELQNRLKKTQVLWQWHFHSRTRIPKSTTTLMFCA